MTVEVSASRTRGKHDAFGLQLQLGPRMCHGAALAVRERLQLMAFVALHRLVDVVVDGDLQKCMRNWIK